MLKDKSILLGVSGSIAAYKTVELIKILKQEGASVSVIMTEASKRFITPLPLELASGDKVYCDMFESPLAHIALPAKADLFIVAPATANTIGKYANGIADDLLSAALLTFKGSVIIAPAMNWRMYESPVFQKNLHYLLSLGVRTIGPERGSLACGEEGIGRMAEIENIVEAVKTIFTKQDMAGEQVLVTAGPTREYIDPVRYVSNRSSGRMGYAIARIAKRRGADVTLVSGPTFLAPPRDIDVLNAETAADMQKAVMDNIAMSSIFIMSAAVADFVPAEKGKSKIEKKERLVLDLNRTEDILQEVGNLKNRPFAVGFSAETGQRLDRARKKLIGKNIDMIVFNDVSKAGAGFDTETNEVVIIDRTDERKVPLMSKDEVAVRILDRILELKNG